MKKSGVIILLNLLVISSILFISNVGFNADTIVIGDNDGSSEVTTEPTPKSSTGIFKYEYDTSVPFQWKDLSSNYQLDITNSFTNGKNDGYYTLALPFGFKLYGQTHWSAYISTNGYLSFWDSTPTIWSDSNFPIGGSDYQYMVAPFWDDLDLNNGGFVYVNTSATEVIIEFKDVWHYSNNYVGSFEVVLHNDSHVEFNYNMIQNIPDGHHTCGINYGDAIKGSQYNGGLTWTQETINWTYDEPIFTQIVYDDFEAGDSIWSYSGGNNYWHVSNVSSYTGMKSMWCGNESTNPPGVFDKKEGGTSIAYTDRVYIDNLDLRDFGDAKLSFYFKKLTNWGPDSFRVLVELSGNQFYLSTKYVNPRSYEIDNLWETGAWNYRELDLTFFCGFEFVDIIFEFSANDWDNYYLGGLLDNVNISGHKSTDNSYDSLGIAVNDEFFYYIWGMEEGLYQTQFGKPAFGSNDQKMKLKIYAITEYTDYWDVTARLWGPGTDFTMIGQSDEYNYLIYKNPLNQKGSADFFVPSTNVGDYVQGADTVDGTFYNINHGSGADPNGPYYYLDLKFSDYRVNLLYSANGVLRSHEIRDDIGNQIYGFYLEQDDYNSSYSEDNNSQDINLSDIMITVPGYDIYIVSSVAFMTLIYIRKRTKKASK